MTSLRAPWRSCVFYLAAAAIAVGIMARPVRAAGAISQDEKMKWVHAGPDGQLVYKTTPAGDRIMDFSHAGYMGGGVTLPEVPVRVTVQAVEGDSTAVIRKAVDEVSAMTPENGFRGAVLLTPGTYTCSVTISITTERNRPELRLLSGSQRRVRSFHRHPAEQVLPSGPRGGPVRSLAPAGHPAHGVSAGGRPRR